MKILQEFLLGECDVVTFMQNYMNDEKLYEYIQNLIPKEAIIDENHEYWRKCILRSGLECYNFDVRNMLYSHCGLGREEKDQREIFTTIRALYLWLHPHQKCTKIYEEKIDFYLDLEQNCFGGPEVSSLVKNIAESFFSISPKSLRKKEARKHIEEAFHIHKNRKPHWLQGPEWPMGNSSPMKFIGQKNEGNAAYFEFQDVDTGKKRIIRQFL